jgi:ribosomal protein S18 acetylase RimI-like enzyme
MQADDWEAVSRLDRLAFNSYYQKTGREPVSQQRTRANLSASLAIFPDGCFVAIDTQPVGFIFSRAVGRLGWIGTFGLDPNYHGQGLGQQLIKRAIASLERAGCVTIGLETMPDSPYNVGLYTHLGFMPVYPTLYMTKATTPAASGLQFDLLSKLDEPQALASITALSQSINPQLDYRVEAQNAKTYGWGNTLLFGWPQPWGFAILRTSAIRGNDSPAVCEIVAAVFTPQARNKLGEALESIQAFACEHQAGQIGLPVNTLDSRALQIATAHGYRVGRVLLRLIYRGELPRSEGIDLSRWAM